MKLRLADEDRKRYGIPEWIDADLATLSVEEAYEVEKAGGRYSLFANGGGVDALLVRMWVMLRRAGAPVPEKIADLRVNVAGFVMDDPSPGKAPSATKSARTRTTSAATSRTSTSRRKA